MRHAVLGRVEDGSEEDARDVSTICGQWPDVTLDTWRDRSGSKGVVLCVKDR